jgi:hypothetical protein
LIQALKDEWVQRDVTAILKKERYNRTGGPLLIALEDLL